ncbi:glycoside hydrolase family 3 N-terminal domain-containing protein [Ferruginibacter sp. SUN002]|uniref:glycoside hydrolase family 3 N-terminal domain-containing protein n=1 Tax=Ferruginibacter sp. SUN002 TaxID=2937789 RepID=UPI003D35DE9D
MNKAQTWADSVYNTLNDDERIAQLMVLRLSTYDFKTRTATFFDKEVTEAVKKYNIGAVCLFQGNPVKQATVLNSLQSLAKTPIMTCIDAEWGVGMRILDSVQSLPHQMMLGAVTDPNIIYQYGVLVGEQCKRLGINVNYAPVVDINNNPNNPVINDRSFGEDKYKVALYGIQYMKGMQDVGVMACAKHFPGHGDVAVDSHLDLPVINKSMEQLDSLELYPFKQIFNAGVGSVMIAHLYIPAIDNSPNRATSISKKNITDLMRDSLGYQGLTFTDALEMQGVKKFFPNGEASVQSLIAGNDMLCLPGDVEMNLKKIKEAIKKKKLSWQDIELHCKKVLAAKYKYSLKNTAPINLDNITADLNTGIPEMKKLVAENAITLLSRSKENFIPLPVDSKATDVAYVGIGISSDNAFAKRMRNDHNAAVFYFNYKQDEGRVLSTVEIIKKKYKKVIIGIHNYSRTPANNFGISASAVDLVNKLQEQTNAVTIVFGNPYAIKNFCNAKSLIACYEDDSYTQSAAIDILQGKIAAKGKLPVTVCDQYLYGSGIVESTTVLPLVNPDEVGLDIVVLNEIDSVAKAAVSSGATPGCVVLVARNGKIAYEKAFGFYDNSRTQPVTVDAVYDVASVTKMNATTLAIMKLYDAGKLDLKKKLGDYLPWVKGTNKENLSIENILLHQAGLTPFIPFYKEVINTNGVPDKKYFSAVRNDSFSIVVAKNLFMRKEWCDTMCKRILQSPLTSPGKYVYSDNDFIFLGKIVETISGKPLDVFVKENFYAPMKLTSTGFNPINTVPLNKIVPTENEKEFRLQLIHGYVHDPGAAMFGGVAGHAGLFSNAYDMAMIMQMLLNGGTIGGKRYLSKSTIDLFTAYHSDSRRGYGFDKPEKDNDKRDEPYPCISASPLTFGHTGFTGTCAWADPKNNLVYIFLSNRINPSAENKKLLNDNVRPKIMETIYKAMNIQ